MSFLPIRMAIWGYVDLAISSNHHGVGLSSMCRHHQRRRLSLLWFDREEYAGVLELWLPNRYRKSHWITLPPNAGWSEEAFPAADYHGWMVQAYNFGLWFYPTGCRWTTELNRTMLPQPSLPEFSGDPQYYVSAQSGWKCPKIISDLCHFPPYEGKILHPGKWVKILGQGTYSAFRWDHRWNTAISQSLVC